MSKQTKAFRLSDRLSVEFEIDELGGNLFSVLCVWDPDVPESLTSQETALYLRALSEVHAKFANPRTTH